MSAESDEAWRRFDELIEAATPPGSPWTDDDGDRWFAADHVLLARLLEVPIDLGSSSQSGIPAKAVDAWLASELRRAGFEPDEVWPGCTEVRATVRLTAPDAGPDELQELFDRVVRTSPVGSMISRPVVLRTELG